MPSYHIDSTDGLHLVIEHDPESGDWIVGQYRDLADAEAHLDALRKP